MRPAVNVWTTAWETISLRARLVAPDWTSSLWSTVLGWGGVPTVWDTEPEVLGFQPAVSPKVAVTV